MKYPSTESLVINALRFIVHPIRSDQGPRGNTSVISGLMDGALSLETSSPALGSSRNFLDSGPGLLSLLK